jgi:hypothetical protein
VCACFNLLYIAHYFICCNQERASLRNLLHFHASFACELMSCKCTMSNVSGLQAVGCKCQDRVGVDHNHGTGVNHVVLVAISAD